MKISAKARLISIIVAVVFMFGALTGTGAYLIVNHLNNTKALNNETNTDINSYIGNMVSSTNNSLVDYNTYSALMTKLGNDTTSTRNKSAINGGTPIVFQMGTVPGTSTPIYWEVVYQTGDTITVWMTQPYTREYFNYDGATYSDGVFSGATQTDYNLENGYSRSTLRQATQRIYSDLNAAYPVFSKVVKSPSNAGVSSWQSSQGNAKYKSSYSSVTNGLGTQASTTNPHGWSWSSCMSDMFWIPSHYEVCNTSTSGSGSSINGLWGLSTTDSAFTTTTLKGSVSVSFCWLRSGISNFGNYAVLVGSSGSASSNRVNGSGGVRPAAHISLSALEDAAKPSYTITTNYTPANSGIVTGDGTYKQGKTVTLTATPATGYQLKGWSTNGGSTIISGSEGKTSYQITVTGNTTYTAVFEPIMYTVTTAVNITEAGTVSGGGSYQYNTQATLTANLTNPNYKFVGWDTTGDNVVDISATTNPYRFTVTGNALVTAIFEKLPTITITTNNENYGKILYNNSLITSTQVIQDSGTQITNIYAIPVGGYAFLYWEDSQGYRSTANPLTYTVSADTTLTAVFGKSVDGVVVTASTGGEARIVGFDDTTITDNDTVTLIAVTYTGYTFAGWYIDGELLNADYGTSAQIRYGEIKDKVVTAIFTPISNLGDMNSQTDNGQIDDFI